MNSTFCHLIWSGKVNRYVFKKRKFYVPFMDEYAVYFSYLLREKSFKGLKTNVASFDEINEGLRLARSKKKL